MEDIREFSKGLNKDTSSTHQPKGTYSHAKNVVQMSSNGDLHSLVNERGTLEEYVDFPAECKVIGKTVLDSEIIVFLVNEYGWSQIGVVKAQYGIDGDEYKYSRLVPSPDEGSAGDENSELGLNWLRGVSVVARKIATGERMVYFCDGVEDDSIPMSFISLDNPPAIGEIADNVKVISNLTMADLSFNSVEESSGNLQVGAYQFVSRYKNKDLTATTFGIPTNVIPIVDNVLADGRNKYDGEYQDVGRVSKSIKIDINDIDTSYSFLEIVAIRYDGEANVFVAHSLPLLNISGTSSSFTYTGDEEFTELTREEIRELSISYSSAKCVTQKDNVLFWSNLRDNSAEIDQELQEFFNSVEVEYITKDFVHDDSDSASIDGYKDPNYTVSFKGFMRDEVYSLGGIVNLKDGSSSFNYHIPGNDKTSTPSGGDNFVRGTGNLLGTYVSETEYPIEQYYPGNLDGDDNSLGSTDRFVRHHKMPSLDMEPHFSNVAGTETVHVLGIKFTFKKALSSDVLEKIQSITFTRERRDVDQNKSILAQGIPNKYVKINTTYSYEGVGTDPVYKKMPFFNNTVINNLDSSGRAEESIAFGPFSAEQRISSFFSPETVLGDLAAVSVVGSKMSPALKISGTGSVDQFLKSQNQASGTFNVERDLRKFYLAWAFGNYNDRVTSDLGSASYPTIADCKYIDNGVESNINTFDDPIRNFDTSRHLYMRTADSDSAITFGNTGSTTMTFKHNDDMATGNTEENYDDFSTGSISTYLTNLTRVNNNQYGSVSGGTYIPIHTTETLPELGDEEVDNVFGGDVFINKFAVRNSDIYFYKALEIIRNGGIYFDSGYTVENADSHVSALQDGMDLRSVNYFFVESTINCDYRHQYVDRTDPDNPKDGVNYYPNASLRSTNEVQVQEGDSHTYNQQYSFENNVKVFSNKLAQELAIGAFENRTIYSQFSNQDNLTDSYRAYPVNNFYDLPRETGKIWNSFVESNTLYLHTPKALWRAYANDKSTQTTDLGDVILGTGDMFSIPSSQMTTTEGGYGGTISQWGNVETPYGYVFADALQGKIFLLQGGQLKEISRQGMKKEMYNRLGKGLFTLGPKGYGYYDEPHLSKGIRMGWDPDLERVLVSVTNEPYSNEDNPGEMFTYSYSFLTASWASEHSYVPNLYVTLDNQMFSINNNGFGLETPAEMYSHNNGEYGKFYGTTYPMELDYVHNEAVGQDKVFDNLAFATKTLDGTIVKPLDTWDTVSLRTDLGATGLYVIKPKGTFPAPYTQGEVWASYIKNKYFLAIPGNAVVDEYLDITDPNNIDQGMLYKPRIKGDLLEVSLKYLNSDNYKFIVNFIACTTRINAR